MKLDFKCGGKLVGRFVEMNDYPTVPGRYQYMPYRGPGHLFLQDECCRSGFARCTYEGANGQVTFTVRTVAGATGTLELEEIGASTS